MPERNDTPSITASAVSANRSLWAKRPFSVSLNTRLLPEVLEPVEDALRGRLEHLVDDLAVGEEHDPVGVARGDRVVGDHHDRLVEVVDGAAA